VSAAHSHTVSVMRATDVLYMYKKEKSPLTHGLNYRSACDIYFFSETHLQVRPVGEFLHAIAQTTRSRARMCLFGVKELKFNI